VHLYIYTYIDTLTMPKTRTTAPTTTECTKAMFETAGAACRYGKIRRDHGLEILIESRLIFRSMHRSFYRNGHTLKLDFHGDIYGSIGVPGAKSLADWMLPLQIYKFNIVDGIVSFVLGAKKLSKKTLDKTLLNMKKYNDPVIIMDVILDPNSEEDGENQILLARVVTKPSKMIESLKQSSEKHTSIKSPLFYNANISKQSGDIERKLAEMNMRRNASYSNQGCMYIPKLIWYHFQYIKYPLFVVCLLFFLVCQKQINTNIVFYNNIEIPRLLTFGMGNTKVTAPGLEHFLPAIPLTRTNAFKLGRLLGILEQLQKGGKSNSTTFTNILHNVTEVLKLPNGGINSTAQIASVLTMLEEEENDFNPSLRKKMFSIFSIVNIIWLIAIIGIMVSILPSIHFILKPLRDFLERVARYVLEYIIQPVLTRLHDWGIIEFGVWALCSLCILDSHRFYGPVAGKYIAITALGGSVLCMTYTTTRHFPTLCKWYYRLRHRDKIERQSIQNIIWYVTASFLIGALHFKSDFLGYISIAAFYYKLGFSGYAVRLCYVFGFDSDNAVYRCVITSFTILNLTIALRLFNFKELYLTLAPIQSPISIFGSIVGNIGLLIISSLYFPNGRRNTIYFGRNLLMVINLLYSYCIGTLYNIDGLTNASIAFLVFYSWTKSYEVIFEYKCSIWLLILGSSVMLWRASLYLHTYPNLLIDMLTGAV